MAVLSGTSRRLLRALAAWAVTVLDQSAASMNYAFDHRARICLSCFVAIVLVAATAAIRSATAEDLRQIPIAFLSQVTETRPALSNLELPPEDEGLAGGRLAIEDNNVTGKFLNQHFALEEVSVPADGDVSIAFQDLIDRGFQFIILNVPAASLLELADSASGHDVLLFNAGAPDDRLRGVDCRSNVLHILPSRAMLTDALAQYLVWKRWNDWFLVIGAHEGDALFAEAIKRSARKFGAKVVAERKWDYGPDMRRTAQSAVPAFTQDADYDILIVADEIGEFGEYLPYRTWIPRPVAGTQGLVPTTWHRTHEQWGAVQLQNRFLREFGRSMTALDYQVWEAIRAVGEGATRANSTAFGAINAYIRSPDFELAAFKGQKLTFRPWDGQLRQPILLAAPKSLVSVSPQPGFLHQGSLLDTLGVDEPESKCSFDR
jgi:ABC transporter substrate binding protein (PQQ-dependent alcohol dehydrogenase system)